MTITQTPDAPPIRLPPVRFHLDDIEKIIAAFRAVEQSTNTRYDNSPPAITFTIGNQVADDIEDLPRIGKAARDFKVELRRTGFVLHAQIGEHNTWYSFGLSEEEEWATYRRLEPIFKARARRIRAALAKNHTLSFVAYGTAAVVGVALFLAPVAYVTSRFDPKAAIATLVILLAPAFLATMKLALRLLDDQSIVILRRSWEAAATRAEQNARYLLAAISALLAFALGFISMMLKHKYWP